MNTRLVNVVADVIHRSQENGKRTPTGIAVDLESAQLLQSPESAAAVERLRLALQSAQRGRRELRLVVRRVRESRREWRQRAEAAYARLAELEKREAVVAEFVAQRAEYITAIRNCHPDNGHDYDRWQGHAAARRQLAELLGLPVAWPVESTTAGGGS